MMTSDECASIVQKGSSKRKRNHNVAERQRRDTIKDCFQIIKDSIPPVHGNKVVTRAQILSNTIEYIKLMKIKNDRHRQDINDVKRQNSLLEAQIKQLERVEATGNYAMQYSNNLAVCVSEPYSNDESEEQLKIPKSRLKKKKKFEGQI